MTLKEKIATTLKHHLVDSTALLAYTSPIYSVIETFGAGMSDEVSINSKFYIAGLTYCGLGWAIGKCRDASRKLFRTNEKTKEIYQHLHDAAYLAAINIPITMGLYTAAGETDTKKLAAGVIMGTITGACIGPWAGYAIDTYRDLTGLKLCERKTYPSAVRNLKPKMKKGLAAMIIAASIGAMCTVYSMTPEQKQALNTQQTLEQIIENK